MPPESGGGWLSFSSWVLQALKADVSHKRVSAFAKRILQVRRCPRRYPGDTLETTLPTLCVVVVCTCFGLWGMLPQDPPQVAGSLGR